MHVLLQMSLGYFYLTFLESIVPVLQLIPYHTVKPTAKTLRYDQINVVIA